MCYVLYAGEIKGPDKKHIKSQDNDLEVSQNVFKIRRGSVVSISNADFNIVKVSECVDWLIDDWLTLTVKVCQYVDWLIDWLTSTVKVSQCVDCSGGARAFKPPGHRQVIH